MAHACVAMFPSRMHAHPSVEHGTQFEGLHVTKHRVTPQSIDGPEAAGDPGMLGQQLTFDQSNRAGRIARLNGSEHGAMCRHGALAEFASMRFL
jgi:hypothetical protein